MGPASPIPEFAPKSGMTEGWFNKWVYAKVLDQTKQHGASLGTLYGLLAAHLATCVLLPPNMQRYLKSVFGEVNATIIDDQYVPREVARLFDP